MVDTHTYIDPLSHLSTHTTHSSCALEDLVGPRFAKQAKVWACQVVDVSKPV